ncbi:MAG: Fur family transcriptional regulator [Candidatus Levyibacteriota bacterium]|jgi:Fur family ferric uptake transcriptional regulator
MVTFFKQHNYKDELQEVSLKATPIRLAVLKFLGATDRPVDALTIIHYLKKEKINADPATIFRMMNDFLQKGITKEVQLEKGKVHYELTSKGDHHHLICEKCGKIEPVEDNFVPEMEKEIAKKHNFLIKRHSLEFFGLCANCQK